MNPRFGMRLLRRLLPVAMVLLALASLGAGLRLALSLGQPFAGVALMWRKEIKMYAVAFSTPPHWPGLAADKLHINDRIVCIDGYMPKPEAAVYGVDPLDAQYVCPQGECIFTDVLRQRMAGGAQAIDIVVDRGGKIITVSGVPLVPFDLPMLLETFLPFFLLSLGLLSVAFVVYRANPGGTLNLVFAAFVSMLTALIVTSNYAAIIGERIEHTTLLSLFIFVPWMPLVGVTFVHLVSLLLVEGRLAVWTRRLLVPYYVISALFALLGIIVFIWDNSILSELYTNTFLRYSALSIVLALVWGVAGLGWTWRKATSRRVRSQMALILAGIGVAAVSMAPYLLFFFSQAPIFRYIHSVPYLGLAVVGVFAYAILRYQLFTSKSAVLHTLLLLIMCIFSANLVYLLLSRQMEFMPILAATVVTGASLETRHRPMSFFTRLWRRDRLDYETVVRFSQRVGALQDPTALFEGVAQVLHGELDVEWMGMVLLYPERGSQDQFVKAQPVSSSPLPQGLSEHLLAQPGPVHDASPAGARYRAFFANAGPVAVWLPLVERGQAVGVLQLGPRWTGELYDEQDLRLLGILSHQLALSVHNIHQLQRLQESSRLIKEVEEAERLKIVSEIHDTILPFFTHLNYGLEELNDQPQDLVTRIDGWEERVGGEADRLREMLRYLRTPHLLVQGGLLPALQDRLEHVRSQARLAIQADLDPEVEQALTVEGKVVLYRVLREALNNAAKHSQGRQVSLQLRRAGKEVCFAIQDDGQGFDVAQASQPGRKGYSSLQDIRTYVESVGGKVQVQSAPGRGTLVYGQVPGI
jgi:signal transduction histidine kinase